MVNEENEQEKICGFFTSGQLYVISVYSTALFATITSQYFVFVGYLKDHHVNSFIVLGVFNTIVLYVLINFQFAVNTSPGIVPIGWEPPISGVNVYELKRHTKKPRYCRTCKGFKPPRSHHCKYCNKCVLKMDHHCPWIDNCVGYYNQGHFIRLLSSSMLAIVYCLCLHLCRLYDLLIDAVHGTFYSRQPTQTEVSFLIINISLMGLLFFSVGAMFVYQLYLISNNTTTIERCEKKRVKKLMKKGFVQNCVYPYDLGFIKNIKSVFGNKIANIFIPFAISGPGDCFEIRSDISPPVYWPPIEYHQKYGAIESADSDSKTRLSEASYSTSVQIRQDMIQDQHEESEQCSSGVTSRTDSDDDFVVADSTLLKKIERLEKTSKFLIPGKPNIHKRTIKNRTHHASSEKSSQSSFDDEDIPLSEIFNDISKKQKAY